MRLCAERIPPVRGLIEVCEREREDRGDREVAGVSGHERVVLEGRASERD